jgi:hypothetical protein
VKNEWSYTSAPPVYIEGVDREDFTVTFMQSGRLNDVSRVMIRKVYGRKL